MILTVDQIILSPTLSHNLLSTMQMRLNYVVVNDTPSFQCFKPTNLSHYIYMAWCLTFYFQNIPRRILNL
jgi:hypothetical protein